MGMSSDVIGFRPPDDRWKKMKDVYDACEAAGVPIPSEVDGFFGCEEPDPRGVEIEIPAEKWEDEYRQGFEITVSDIPAGCTVIRFYNSW